MANYINNEDFLLAMIEYKKQIADVRVKMKIDLLFQII